MFSSGGHFAQLSGNTSNFGRASLEEYLSANILKSGHWPRMRCLLKSILFLALAAILFSGAEPLWPS